uniref:N-acetyltransferase domain-containing protein n=1 Tax=Mycena chlorophos TaxID=658473 RepID=A0ABQ0M290_MYCCL|nr:predicted protein [Mycena chlorophos]
MRAARRAGSLLAFTSTHFILRYRKYVEWSSLKNAYMDLRYTGIIDPPPSLSRTPRDLVHASITSAHAARFDYLVFYASIDPTQGRMWCGDCRRVEEVVRRVFDDAGGPSAAIVYVGSKPEWKSPTSAFRGEPFILTDVPTIAKLERDGNGNVGIVKLVDTEIDAGLPAFVAGGRGVAEVGTMTSKIGPYGCFVCRQPDLVLSLWWPALVPLISDPWLRVVLMSDRANGCACAYLVFDQQSTDLDPSKTPRLTCSHVLHPPMTISHLPTQGKLDENKIIVQQHLSAVEFLSVAYPILQNHEASSNIVLAHALSHSPADFVLTECRFIDTVKVPPPPNAIPVGAENFWLTVWTSTRSTTPVLQLVLACITSSAGNAHPIFLWGEPTLAPENIGDAVATFLRGCVLDATRVFSVFGPTSLVDAFSRSWTTLTGFRQREEPLYDAFFASCSLQTLRSGPRVIDGVRKAIHSDAEMVGELVEGFFNDSGYVVDASQAKAEAVDLITKGLVWVYETETREIASFCAVTRTSLRVAAITRVYTFPEWRRRCFAYDLVREVVHRLFEFGKQRVVLYVGKDNNARHVYERVGFDVQDDGYDWKEIGFEEVAIRHW